MLNQKTAFIFSFLLITFTQVGNTQTVLESSLTDDRFTVETWWTKPIDKQYKFVLFNLNTAEYLFDLDQSQFMSYSVLNIDVWKGLGPVIGTRILQDKVAGLVGIQYTFFSQTVFITTNFTTETKSNPDFEFYTLAQYRPKLSRLLNGFIQTQLSFNFNANQHLFSFQQIRLGPDFKTYQFGLAINQFQLGSNWENEVHPGIFFRLEFQ
ncbi:MAG: hypothetical protein AAFO07_09925 [Bacteroidota bacterium]